MPDLKETIQKLKQNETVPAEDVLSLLRDYKDCVNELCYECGQYKQEHEGSCDGCRWQRPRKGW